jgi:hypothetical protein
VGPHRRGLQENSKPDICSTEWSFSPQSRSGSGRKKPVPLASFSKLVGPDLIIALIFLVLATRCCNLDRVHDQPAKKDVAAASGGIPQAMQQSSPSQ